MAAVSRLTNRCHTEDENSFEKPSNKLCTACGILAIGAFLLGGWVVVTTLILPERMLFLSHQFSPKHFVTMAKVEVRAGRDVTQAKKASH
jgi:hypothetical protein